MKACQVIIRKNNILFNKLVVSSVVTMTVADPYSRYGWNNFFVPLIPGKKPAKKLVEPLNKAGVRVYVVTTGGETNSDDYEDVVTNRMNAKHVPDTNDLPDLAPSIVEKIKKYVKKRKFDNRKNS